MPGIAYERLVHCVESRSAGQTGVISTPVLGASIASVSVVMYVSPL